MADISCNLTLPLLKMLEEEKKSSGKSTTVIVQEALNLYFKPLPSPEVITFTQEQLDQLKEVLNSQPIYPIPKIVPLQASDIVSTLPTELNPYVRSMVDPGVQDEFVVDPEIKQSFHLGEIKSGPGIVQRLKAAGISAQAVINSRRAKNAGRDYDKSLEQYFELV